MNQNFDSTNGKIKNCESLSKRRLPQKNYLYFYKSYVTWMDNQRQRENYWTPVRKNHLKILANNRKGVSQRRFGRKLDVSHDHI